MVGVSHLFFFLRKYFRGRCDSGESHRPLSGTIYFPTAPSVKVPVYTGLSYTDINSL